MVFDRQVENLMKYAVMKALYFHNEYITPEHLLSAMCQEREFGKVVRSMGGSVQEIVDALDEFFEEMLPKGKEPEKEEEMAVSDAASAVLERI